MAKFEAAWRAVRAAVADWKDGVRRSGGPVGTIVDGSAGRDPQRIPTRDLLAEQSGT